MFTRKAALIVALCPLLFIGCAHFDKEAASIAKLNRSTLNTTLKTDALKVQKRPNAPIEILDFKKAVTENEGTAKEKLCMCQSISYRVSQLAAQAWPDGVFRTYDVQCIRTGWNTPGPYEFFSDREMNGEIGDLEIPANKIVVEQLNGDAARPPMSLTDNDGWFEITFNDGRVLMVNMNEGFFPEGFLASRALKKGNAAGKAIFKKKYSQAIERLISTPFQGMSAEWVRAN